MIGNTFESFNSEVMLHGQVLNHFWELRALVDADLFTGCSLVVDAQLFKLRLKL